MAAPAGRVSISLSAAERAALKQLAGARSEPEATTAARLVRAGLDHEGAVLDTPPARRRGPASAPATPRERPDPRPAITMLLERYSLDLANLRSDLQADRLAAERLAALALWRELLDADTGADPRSELAFHAELVAVARWLEERGRRRR